MGKREKLDWLEWRVEDDRHERDVERPGEIEVTVLGGFMGNSNNMVCFYDSSFWTYVDSEDLEKWENCSLLLVVIGTCINDKR